MISAIAGRAIPSSKRQLAFTAISAVLVTVVATVVFGYDPVAQIGVFTALVAGDTIIMGLMAIGGFVGLVIARVVGRGRKSIVALATAGAAGGAVTATTLSTTGIVAAVLSGGVALAVGNPVLTGMVGAAVVFFVADPLATRGGGFGSSLSFAVKIATVSVLAYLTVIHAGPELSAIISTTPAIIGIQGDRDGA